MTFSKKILIPVSIVFLFLSFIISLICGAAGISISELFSSLCQNDSVNHTILFSIRLPRTLLALISGALLAGCGAAFQMYFRNSLAEPGIAGISAGATLGAVIFQSIFSSFDISKTLMVSGINLFAFSGAMISGILLCLVSGISKNRNPVTILLFGTAAGTFYSAISSFLLILDTKNLQGIFSWVLGSFNGRGWNEFNFILLPSIVSAFLLFFSGAKLDLMAGGENSAESLGLNTKRLQILILIASSLAVSSSVCAGGTISFVGLISPHIVRKLFGESNCKGRFLITSSMIFGAILVLLSDSIARIIIAPSEIPAGLITSFLGAPFFLFLIFKKKDRF